MLRGLTTDDLPLPDPERIWAVIAARSGTGFGAADTRALVTRLRALALVALDAAEHIEGSQAPTERRRDDAAWHRAVGQDLVERAAQALGVHHARRAAEVRDELRLRYKLATAVERVEGELLELGTTLRGTGAVPRRVRRDVATSLLARLRAEVATRPTGVPESWVACLDDLELLRRVFSGSVTPIAVGVVAGRLGVTREKIYAARKWWSRLEVDGRVMPGRLEAHLELRGPPRG